MTLTASKQFPVVRDALTAGCRLLENTSASARLDAELLLATAVAKGRAWLYANPDAELTDRQSQVFAAMLAQRAEGRPIAHLTGEREFWSRDLAVSEFTLVPRPETEVLVEQALEQIPVNAPCRVLDLGTGSGAIAIAIACERPAAAVTATDRSREALQLALENAERHCPDRIEFLQGNWYQALPTDAPAFDVIVTNPPYVAENESHLTDPELAFEPVDALYSGADGLDAIRMILSGAARHLRRDGWLLLEHGFAQAADVQNLFSKASFASINTVRDLARQPRVTYGQQQ